MLDWFIYLVRLFDHCRVGVAFKDDKDLNTGNPETFLSFSVPYSD